MQNRESKRKPRQSKKAEEAPKSKETIRKELLKKLHSKIKEKQVERTNHFVRDKRIEELEELLDKDDLTAKQRAKLQKELDMLIEIEDREATFAGEFPEYQDYDAGGSMVRND